MFVGEVVSVCVYQHVPKTRPSGGSCQSIVTNHIRYCGISSYIQTLLARVTKKPRSMSMNDCADRIERNEVVLKNWRRYRIKVPRERGMLEVIANRVMIRQSKSCHIGGHFLNNVIVNTNKHIKV